MKTDQAHRPRPSAEVRVINAHIQFISERSLLVFLLKMGIFFVAKPQQTRPTAHFIRNTYNEDNITSA
jgi:hypothetical protein